MCCLQNVQTCCMQQNKTPVTVTLHHGDSGHSFSCPEVQILPVTPLPDDSWQSSRYHITRYKLLSQVSRCCSTISSSLNRCLFMIHFHITEQSTCVFAIYLNYCFFTLHMLNEDVWIDERMYNTYITVFSNMDIYIYIYLHEGTNETLLCC